MLISHVYLFTNVNEISLQVTMEDLPLFPVVLGLEHLLFKVLDPSDWLWTEYPSQLLLSIPRYSSPGCGRTGFDQACPECPVKSRMGPITGFAYHRI